jgi:hypothetical protein
LEGLDWLNDHTHQATRGEGCRLFNVSVSELLSVVYCDSFTTDCIDSSKAAAIGRGA